MYVVIWEYETHRGSEHAFEQLYGAAGAWVELFREYNGYMSTELLRDERPQRYVTVDRWESEADYVAFLADAASRYAELDATGDALTAEERRIGRYTAC
jgi:heme-degrading monooxygenase HmoA